MTTDLLLPCDATFIGFCLVVATRMLSVNAPSSIYFDPLTSTGLVSISDADLGSSSLPVIRSSFTYVTWFHQVLARQ